MLILTQKLNKISNRVFPNKTKNVKTNLNLDGDI